MNQNRCHQPTHNLNISNPPSGGSGVPQKANTESINNWIAQLLSINEGLTDIELKIDACGTIVNKASSMQTDIILLTDAVMNLTDLCLTLEKRIEVMEKSSKDMQTKLNKSEKQNCTGFNVSNLTNDELAVISFALNHLPASAYISDRLLDTWLSMCNIVNSEEVKRGI